MKAISFLAVFGLFAAGAAARCDFRLPVQHLGSGGSFDFTYASFAGVAASCQPIALGPPVRVWEYGNYALARFDPWLAPPLPPCFEPWLNRALDLAIAGAHPGQWLAVGADWWGAGSTACPSASLATDVEVSFSDAAREGTVDHRGLYAIAVVEEGCPPDRYDLDQVADALGPSGNIVPVRAIPPPEALVLIPIFDPAFVDIEVALSPAPSHGTSGRPDGVWGYRMLYALGSEPTTSSPLAWTEVRDPAMPLSPLGPVPLAVARVAVKVPRPLGDLHIATRLIYDSADGPMSEAVSAHRSVSPIPSSLYSYPELVIAKTMTPASVAPGDPVTVELRVTNGGLGAARNVEVWDVMSQDLEAGCLALGSARNLGCTGCDDVSWDPASGKLRGFAASLAVAGTIVITLDFDAGPGAASCRNTAWATAERHRYVTSTAVLDNPGGTVKLLRDDSIRSLTPRPDFAAIFPLAVYRDPAPPFPFTDEVDLLDDETRRLVLYGYNRPGVLKLVKDKTPGVNSVVIAP